jgi:hypothetical protein
MAVGMLGPATAIVWPCKLRNSSQRAPHRSAFGTFARKAFPASANASSTSGRSSPRAGWTTAPTPRPPRPPRVRELRGSSPPPSTREPYPPAPWPPTTPRHHPARRAARPPPGERSSRHSERRVGRWAGRATPAQASPSSAPCSQRSPPFRGHSRRGRSSRGGARDRPRSTDPAFRRWRYRPRRGRARWGRGAGQRYAPPPHTRLRPALAATATRASPPLSRARPGGRRPDWQDGQSLRSPILSTTPL